MEADTMTFEQLKEKAHSLPLEPGVYLMQNQSNTVIYVGKAKKLRNRVSQYFQDSASHTAKTRRMVSQIDHFDVIVARTEFEALVLECSLIKRHMPKYNILLKDDKGYPYLRIDRREEYPVMEIVSRVTGDGADYFGPFGGRSVTSQLMDTLRLTFHLPGCSKVFPRDLGKERPCLNYHMNNCDGWCQLGKSPQEYRARMDQVVLLLKGKYQTVADDLRREMEEAAEALEFERAALLRDRLLAIENLGKKQLVTAGTMAHTDVIGYSQNTAKGCFSVLHYVDGSLLDKDYEIVAASDSVEEAVSTLVKQYYLSRNCVPKEILLPVEMEDAELFAQLLQETYQKRVHIRVPQRGDGVRLVFLANKNAAEEAERITSREEKRSGTVEQLRTLLKLENPIVRMESYDISNTAGTDIVASMVVFVQGKPSKKDYKRFKLRDMAGQDDYGSMRQVLTRRFTRYLHGDTGFAEKPDLLLIDGGVVHAQTAEAVLAELGLSFPVYGMVKDDRHRTRALVRADGSEIGIQTLPPVFALIGQIQEETHRFAITYHRSLQSRHMRESVLDQIPGVGEVRKKALLTKFRTVSAIEKADEAQLAQVIPASAAKAVYEFFQERRGENACASSQDPPEA